MIDVEQKSSLRFFYPPVEPSKGQSSTFSPQTADIFSPSCPSVESVQAALQRAQCLLQRTLHLGKQAAQYHFEGPYGTSVLFLAGYDTSNDGNGHAPVKHEARFWIRGNTHPRSLDVQHRLCKLLIDLTAGNMVVQEYPLLLSEGA